MQPNKKDSSGKFAGGCMKCFTPKCLILDCNNGSEKNTCRILREITFKNFPVKNIWLAKRWLDQLCRDERLGFLKPENVYASNLQYRSNVSWQSLASRSSRLETRFAILENFENRVSSRVSRILRIENRVSSWETNEVVAWVISREINRTNRPKSIARNYCLQIQQVCRKMRCKRRLLCEQMMTNDRVMHLEFAAPFLIG